MGFSSRSPDREDRWPSSLDTDGFEIGQGRRGRIDSRRPGRPTDRPIARPPDRAARDRSVRSKWRESSCRAIRDIAGTPPPPHPWRPDATLRSPRFHRPVDLGRCRHDPVRLRRLGGRVRPEPGRRLALLHRPAARRPARAARLDRPLRPGDPLRRRGHGPPLPRPHPGRPPGGRAESGRVIPDWAHRDVLYMLIDYSEKAYRLLHRPLTVPEQAGLYEVFRRVGEGLAIHELPETYEEW